LSHSDYLVRQAGPTVASYLLLLHAWSDSDTTSETFGKGKIGFVKKFKQSKDVQMIVDLMID